MLINKLVNNVSIQQIYLIFETFKEEQIITICEQREIFKSISLYQIKEMLTFN
jgi:hypothetical protein